MSSLTYNTTRIIKAPKSKVFEAWTTKDILEKWFPPQADDWSSEIQLEPRLGGSYLFAMASPEGNFTVRGEYTRFEPTDRLEFTWRWDDYTPEGNQMVVSVEFFDHPDGTEVRLTHDHFIDEQAAKDHEDGWGKVFHRLTIYFNPMEE